MAGINPAVVAVFARALTTFSHFCRSFAIARTPASKSMLSQERGLQPMDAYTRIRVGAGAFNACGPGSFMETIFLLA